MASEFDGWSSSRAHRLKEVLWEPCGHFLSVLPPGKSSVMFAMLCSSLVWAGAVLLALWFIRMLLYRRQ
jgi:hypothetical protein